MNPSEPAFPCEIQLPDGHAYQWQPGISARLYIATHVLQGLLAGRIGVNNNGVPMKADEDTLPLAAIVLADSLMENERKHPYQMTT